MILFQLWIIHVWFILETSKMCLATHIIFDIANALEIAIRICLLKLGKMTYKFNEVSKPFKTHQSCFVCSRKFNQLNLLSKKVQRSFQTFQKISIIFCLFKWLSLLGFFFWTDKTNEHNLLNRQNMIEVFEWFENFFGLTSHFPDMIISHVIWFFSLTFIELNKNVT